MTKFNPENKKVLTYHESLGPAMSITDEEDAKQYFKALVEYLEKQLKKDPREDNKTAEQIARSNLGYFAGYCDHETRIRVERLFMCTHPIFGKAVEHKSTVDEALTKGMQFGKELRKK